jgi:hypothetical protein
MAYKLLGMLTWKGAKWFLRRKYGAAVKPKPLLVGGAVALGIGILLAARQRSGANDG